MRCPPAALKARAPPREALRTSAARWGRLLATGLISRGSMCWGASQNAAVKSHLLLRQRVSFSKWQATPSRRRLCRLRWRWRPASGTRPDAVLPMRPPSACSAAWAERCDALAAAAAAHPSWEVGKALPHPLLIISLYLAAPRHASMPPVPAQASPAAHSCFVKSRSLPVPRRRRRQPQARQPRCWRKLCYGQSSHLQQLDHAAVSKATHRRPESRRTAQARKGPRQRRKAADATGRARVHAPAAAHAAGRALRC